MGRIRELYYPEADGEPMAENTVQYDSTPNSGRIPQRTGRIPQRSGPSA